MARHSIDEKHRKCDECGKESIHRKDDYGSMPFAGWIVIRKERELATNRPVDDMDFCSLECCVKHFREGGNWHGQKHDNLKRKF